MSQFEQYLTAEQREQIVAQRVASHAAEGFQHEINLAIAEASGDQEAAANAQKAIDIIAAAIAVETSALSVLRSPEPAVTYS